MRVIGRWRVAMIAGSEIVSPVSRRLEDNGAMRRWVFMAALSAALLVPPLWGQRGGHGGMPGGGVHAAPSVVPHGGTYGGGGSHGGYVHGAYGHPGHLPYYPGHYRYTYPYGWGYGGYGYPYASWGWYGGVGWSGTYDSSTEQAAPAYAYAPPDNSGGYVAEMQQREIDRLDAEVERLRAEREAGATVTSAPPRVQIRAETVIVYRNHHTEEIGNYAIVGQTLWVFNEQRARRVPIAELDVPATVKANDARGIDFQLPTQ